MRLTKLLAAVMAMILVVQVGCDLWCQHAQEATPTQSQNGAAPPCHGTEEGSSDAPHQPWNHGATKDCTHPEAADDNSKLQSKIARAGQFVAFIESPVVVSYFPNAALLAEAVMTHDVKLAGPHLSILRI